MLIFDISLSSQGLKVSVTIFVDASFCFCETVLTNSPGDILPPQGEEGACCCLPAVCLTFGGVYGVKQVCFFALNFALVNSSGTNVCLNKVPNMTGC